MGAYSEENLSLRHFFLIEKLLNRHFLLSPSCCHNMDALIFSSVFLLARFLQSYLFPNDLCSLPCLNDLLQRSWALRISPSISQDLLLSLSCFHNMDALIFSCVFVLARVLQSYLFSDSMAGLTGAFNTTCVLFRA